MIKISDAIKEKQEISARTYTNDSSRMYFHDILRYVNITEYQSLLDNIKFFLGICPRSMDREKRLEFWKYLKGYLKGLRYVNQEMIQMLNSEQIVIEAMPVNSIDNFYEEINRFCQKDFLPLWLSVWENK